jgi:MYXO-CTERM domain-containing protein
MPADKTLKNASRTARGAAGAVILALVSVNGCSQQTATDSSTSPATTTPHLAADYERLAGGPHPAALPELDRGALDPTTRIANLSMAFKLSPAQLADREALKAALVNPSSPSYRKFLTPREYAARFGAPRATIERARSWLASQGLEVHEESPLGARVTFSGTVDKLTAAFQMEMRRYEVAGEMHYAARTAPALPADLAEAVAAITNTHDFHPKPALHVLKAPEYTAGNATAFAPPDWANVYDATALYTTGIGGKQIDGTGVGIAVVGVAQIAQSDIDAWRSTFNLGGGTLTMTLVPNTGASLAGKNGTGFEAVLDVEWAGGIAPGAAINLVYVGANDRNVDDATYYAIENNLAPVLSESWGSCEEYYAAAGLGPAQQNLVDIYGSAANVLGITYVAAAGDAGAATCTQGGGSSAIGGLYVSVPAAYPGVTAVGGTQFPASALSGSPYFTGYSTQETVWNQSGAGAGGGGVSVIFDRPSYQSGVPACPIVGSLPVAGITAATQRQVPDVAFTSAGPGATVPLFVECTFNAAFGDCSATGGSPKFNAGAGTSFATPAFAGVVALMNQAAGGRLGNVNPLLYELSATTPAAFHDITTGNNEVACTPGSDVGCPAGRLYGFPAVAGYDCASGLGSMDVYNAVAAVAGQASTTTTLAIAPTSTTEGTPVSFTATVTVPAPNASALGGLVTFAYQSYDRSGKVDDSWTLGTGAITGGTTAQGTATFSGAVPPGLVKPGMQSVDVVAMYGGDATHLPSTSAKVPLAFGPVSLAIQPATATAPLGGKITFTASGGVGPMFWITGTDTTCTGAVPSLCSKVDQSGVFTAGSQPGKVQVIVIDADGAYTVATVTVVCTPLTACPAGADCGTLSDGCGGTITCGTGSCVAPKTCGGGGTQNVCGCKATNPCAANGCGSMTDSCGNAVMCGTCGKGDVCVANACVAGPVDAGTTDGGAEVGADASAGAEAGDAAASGSGPSTASSGGCGCRAASDTSSSLPLPAGGVLAALVMLRVRRRRTVALRPGRGV